MLAAFIVKMQKYVGNDVSCPEIHGLFHSLDKRQLCSPVSCNLHLRVFRLDHDLAVQHEHAPLVGIFFEGTIVTDRFHDAPVNRRHDDAPVKSQPPFASRLERYDVPHVCQPCQPPFLPFPSLFFRPNGHTPCRFGLKARYYCVETLILRLRFFAGDIPFPGVFTYVVIYSLSVLHDYASVGQQAAIVVIGIVISGQQAHVVVPPQGILFIDLSAFRGGVVIAYPQVKAVVEQALVTGYNIFVRL